MQAFPHFSNETVVLVLHVIVKGTATLVSAWTVLRGFEPEWERWYGMVDLTVVNRAEGNTERQRGNEAFGPADARFGPEAQGSPTSVDRSQGRMRRDA